jgi:hypothetical protein
VRGSRVAGGHGGIGEGGQRGRHVVRGDLASRVEAHVVAQHHVERARIDERERLGDVGNGLERVGIEPHEPRVNEPRDPHPHRVGDEARIERLGVVGHEHLEGARLPCGGPLASGHAQGQGD